jgi:ABC-type transport system involved in multi-copper enzyme maturation permease subunit
MAFRLGPGPVFIYESLILARRWHIYAGRSLFVLVLLIGLAIARQDTMSREMPAAAAGARTPTLQRLALLGENFFYTIAGIQLTMVLLLAPMATAGAICQDRARGVFAHLAVTDLSDAEIVLGKLGSRLAPVLGVLACALPVMALASLLGGIDPQALFSLFAVSVALAVLGCSLALALSARSTKTHDVIIAVLALWILWLILLPIWSGLVRGSTLTPPPDWFQKAHPFVLVYAPYTRPGYVSPRDVALFVAAALLVSTVLVAWTIATVRRNVLEPARRASSIPFGEKLRRKRWQAWLPGPSLDFNPVLWREWHHNRPSRLTRIIWVLYGVGSVIVLAVGTRDAIVYGLNGPDPMLIVALLIQFTFGLLILSSIAPTSLAEERVRGSVDVLMSTPLSTLSILWGKWLGTYRLVLWLTILPGIASAILACLAPSSNLGPVWVAAQQSWVMADVPLTPLERIAAPCLVVGEMLSYGAVITSLGLVLAIRIPRLGRAIAMSVATFVLVSFGWIMLGRVLLEPLQNWLETSWGMESMQSRWVDSGLAIGSPLAAPIATIEPLMRRGPLRHARWRIWICADVWCLLAWGLALALFYDALQTFDRYLGRMPERGALNRQRVSSHVLQDHRPRIASNGLEGDSSPLSFSDEKDN